jgi:hypothetical protein
MNTALNDHKLTEDLFQKVAKFLYLVGKNKSVSSFEVSEKFSFCGFMLFQYILFNLLIQTAVK